MSNLLTRRAIAFLLAVALAFLAALAVWNYVQGVREEAAAEVERVIGFVATQRIDVGTLADRAIELGWIEQAEIPSDLRTESTISDLNQITGRAVQDVILPGDIIVSGRFAAPGENTDVLTIPPDHQAVSFEVGVPPGVAGFLREGDFVSVIATIEAAGAGQAATSGDDEDAAPTAAQNRSEYLLQDVLVLAVGRRVQPTDDDPAGSTVSEAGTVLVTAALLPDEAERLVFAQANGALYLTLLPEDEREPVTTPGRTVENLFDES